MTKPPRPPDFIVTTPDIYAIINDLAPESDLRKDIDDARKKLNENMFVGDQVEKKKIPRYYIQKHGIYNVYRIDLKGPRRLTYTIIADGQRRGVLVLEIFQTHKEYDRRMGYG